MIISLIIIFALILSAIGVFLYQKGRLDRAIKNLDIPAETVNRPDWWTIGITAVNAVIMVWLGWKQYKLQKQQNKIQEYQTELQKQQKA